MPYFRSLRMIVLVAALPLLAACQSDEERAEAFFQSAMELMEAGDTDRARVEFLNVFNHDGRHEPARSNLAAMLRDTGDLEQSYSQYLRLVEQYPDHVEGRLALAEMALGFGNWAEARRHGERALELAPQDARAEIVSVNLRYVEALEAQDEAARAEVLAVARPMLEANPGSLLLQRVVTDGLVRDGALEEALGIVEAGLQIAPDNRELHDTRLQILATLGRGEDLVVALQEAIALFPEDNDLRMALLRVYVTAGDLAAAQALLRDRAAAATEAGDRDAREAALAALVRLRLDTEGRDAALAELDRAIAEDEAAGSSSVVLRILRSGLQYEAGDRDTAVAELEALLETEITRAEAGNIQVLLAQIELDDGDEAGARARIEQVLAEDPSQVDALKMLAVWLIRDDETSQAISRLRTALDERPDDSAALTLMAEAHARSGNRQLSREFLALAVEASGRAPAETLRYVEFLIADGRYGLAEESLQDALRVAPDNPDLLAAMGTVYLRQEDWDRAEVFETSLREAGTELTEALADQLRTAILIGRGQTTDALIFLEDLATFAGDGDINAQIAVIRARLATGDSDGALGMVESLLSEDPENPALRMTLAAIQGVLGRHDLAEDIYRALLAEAPETQAAWIGLIRSLATQGQTEAARSALDEARAVLPDAPDLLWAQASYLEQVGDIEGAIAIYEDLYDRLPDAPVVANNLASLISTFREDAESLERAYTIARRLRGTDVPAFQDTYGWIAYRRGEYQEALEHLEPAASELPGDALVQYHLAMTYLALGRREEALSQFQRAIRLAGPDDSRPQFETARAEIAALEAALEPASDQE
jgi:tetratricopeptide (TPR) repeat protein